MKKISFEVCARFLSFEVCAKILSFKVCVKTLSFEACVRGEEQFRYHNLSLLPLLPPANGFPLFLQLQLWFLHVLYVPCPKHSHSYLSTTCVAPERNYFVVLRFSVMQRDRKWLGQRFDD